MDAVVPALARVPPIIGTEHELMQRGITSFGAYMPRRRLTREAIAAAIGWAVPAASGMAKGHKAICSHDEDSITMAVAAGRHAVDYLPDTNSIRALYFASTTMPFADRQNAGLIGAAAGLSDSISAVDIGGALKAGVASLRLALEGPDCALVVAADKRLARPGSAQEMRLGDAAAAIAVGTGDVLAEFIAAHAVSLDFTDHYRASGQPFDYVLEERWARDEGLAQVIPKTVLELTQKAGIEPADIGHFIPAALNSRDATAMAKASDISTAALPDDIAGQCGDTGCAHPLLLLTSVLQKAKPGDYIVVLGYGQGAEAILLKATERVAEAAKLTGAQAMLADGVEDDNYLRYLSFNGLVEMDWGMRAERDNRTAQSAFFRHRDTVTRFVGGRCSACGTAQFPRSRVCVNPDCRETDTQEAEPFAHKRASVKSFTEDWLALSFNPPLMYGNIRFEGGGVAMLEFSDFAPGELAVGSPLEMQFRIKDIDTQRGFRRYCWKAVPPRELESDRKAAQAKEELVNG